MFEDNPNWLKFEEKPSSVLRISENHGISENSLKQRLVEKS